MKISYTLKKLFAVGMRAAALTLMAGTLLPMLHAAEDAAGTSLTIENNHEGTSIEGVSDSLDNNELNITNSILKNTISAYAKEITADLTGNTLNITGSTLTGNAIAASAEDSYGSLNNNSLTISDSKTNNAIAAFYENSDASGAPGTFNGNVLILDNGSDVTRQVITAYVYHNASGEMSNNLLIIRNGSHANSGKKNYAVASAYCGSDAAYAVNMLNNRVVVDGSKVSYTLSAAYRDPYNAAAPNEGDNNFAYLVGNSVTITGGSEVKHVWAAIGAEYFRGELNNNSVTITDSTADGNIYGGYISNNTACATMRNNSIVVENSTITGSIYGTRATMGGGDTYTNSVSVSQGSTVNGNIFGGRTVEGTASGNMVSISDSEVKGDKGVYSGFSSNGDVAENVVTLDNCTVAGSVYGGYTDSGNATGNAVTYLNSTITGAVYGGYSAAGNATNNTVEIDGCTVTGAVYGGYAADGKASGNTVVIDGGTITGSVYGGYAATPGSEATDNTVIIKAGTDVEQATLFGGYAATLANVRSTSLNGTTSNNRLILDGFQGKVSAVENVDSIEIILRDWNPTENVLELANDLDLTNKTVTVTLVSIAADVAPEAVETSAPLFATSDDTVTVTLPTDFSPTLLQQYNVKKGITYLYDFVADESGNKLVKQNMRINPQVKALSEGRIAAMSLNYRAADLASEQGMEQATLAGRAGKTVSTFSALSGGHSKADSGSHVNVDGMSALFGASASVLKDKALTLGGFVESGWGQYTTHNTFVDMPGVRGTGESSYVGAGLLARYAFNTRCTRGMALDASLRLGRQTTDFNSTDLNDGTRYADYELNSSYVGGHVGISRTFSPTESLGAMVYGRYIWSHLGSESAELCGDRVNFDSMHSNRLRFGVRGTWQATDKWQPYAGLAYNWECSGAAHATSAGEPVSAPSLRGGSIIGELGTTWQPNLNRPLWFNGGVQGSAGKVQSYGAHVGCTLAF